MDRNSVKEPMAVFDETVSFAERIAAVSLFPADERIVGSLRAVPAHELGIMTSSDLSQLSGASRSSIDRLSRKLGYPGLKEMRKALLLESAALSPAAAGGGTADAGQIGERVMLAIAARAQALGRSLANADGLERLIARMLSARQIVLFGAGESTPVCSAIHLRLVRLGLPVQFAEEHHMQVTLASLMQAGDVAIAVSFSGTTKSTLWAVGVARSSGAEIVAISGTPGSALNKMADLRIDLPNAAGLPGSPEVLDRMVATGLSEVLFQCLIANRPELLAASDKIDEMFAERRS